MKVLGILLIILLVFGCTSPVTIANITDITNLTNQSPTGEWVRYTAIGFSFEYPSNMITQQGNGIFMAQSDLNGTTGGVLVVTYFNTSVVYGENKDNIFKENPTKTASDFLIEDKEDDEANFLDQAYEVGNASTFSIGRDAYVAEVPFKIRFSGFRSTYTGYALDLYTPERSIHAKVRIIALDPEVAKKIKDRFLLSFRIE